ncbi:MAG: hypothetical protein IEMM0008_1287 [bacterium]|nr:MAG: hypothetical protein IEMM0008_1287 [bacterium]
MIRLDCITTYSLSRIPQWVGKNYNPKDETKSRDYDFRVQVYFGVKNRFFEEVGQTFLSDSLIRIGEDEQTRMSVLLP